MVFFFSDEVVTFLVAFAIFFEELFFLEVTFLLDTGATNVSIPVRIARAIGLKPTGRTHMVQTASGSVPVDEVLLETVSIGNITIEYVDASINPSDHSDKILLGMSALRKLEFTHKDGKLILRQEKNR